MSFGANYQVALDVFEGPLDLLLHLVKKHELEILDIPIAFVTQKYLEYLDAMQRLDIDVAGEYLVMAATLCHLKSRELLPNPEPEPTEELDEDAPIEEIDTRAELIKRLLEYQKYKEAANRLGDRPVVGRNVWGRGTALEDALAEGIDAEAVAPLAPFPVHRLIEALDRLMRSANQGHPQRPDRPAERQPAHQRADRPPRARGHVHVHVDVPVRPARRRDDLRRDQARGGGDAPGGAGDGQAAADLESARTRASSKS